ncbi:hypothetical protein KM043_003081 [Ampulex compressa]|nr:hypothetical protein KM043_003081 [Ampulex compressa]
MAVAAENVIECIQGTCLSMCPEKERWMRERQGLLHRFEIDESRKDGKRPKADPEKIIKSFGRPAAGQIMTDPAQLRPGPVLLRTIEYLFTKTAVRSDVKWICVYDFIFDRLRSVRQDIAIQRIAVPETIRLFEPIVRFYVYAAQRLCEQGISEYDPKINEQHMTDCIKHLLVLYDELDRMNAQCDDHLKRDKEKLSDNRQQLEAIYILLYMGNVEVLKRALVLPNKLRLSKDIQLAIKISLAWYLRNYVRVFRLIHQLSPILVCAAMTNLRSIRRNALEIMNNAYSSRTLTFPGIKLQMLLLYKDIGKLASDCTRFGITFSNQNISFQKANFQKQETLANPEMHYTSDVLHKLLPRIILDGL